MDPQTFIPPTMRALFYTKDGGIAFDMDYPTPKPSPAQYLIQVQTAAIDGDLDLQLSSSSSSPTSPKASLTTSTATTTTPKIPPVHSLCGTVISTPAQDHWNQHGPRFKIGDEVYGLVRERLSQMDDSDSSAAAAADYVLVTEDELAFKPKNITAAEAACIPLPGLMAWQALFSKEYGGGLDLEQPSSFASGGRGGLRVLVTSAIESEVGIHCLHLLRSSALSPPSVTETGTDTIWICATCSNEEQKQELLQNKNNQVNVKVNEVIVVTPRSTRDGAKNEDFDLTASFQERGLEPVDLVLDCTRPADGGGKGELYRQAHSPAVLRDGGVVLSVGGGVPYTASLAVSQSQIRSGSRSLGCDHGHDPGHVHPHAHGHGLSIRPDSIQRDLKSEFIHVQPDGDALGRITRLVEERSVRGRVRRVVDLWAGADALEIAEGNVADAGESERDKMRKGRNRGMVVLRVNY